MGVYIQLQVCIRPRKTRISRDIEGFRRVAGARRSLVCSPTITIPYLCIYIPALCFLRPEGARRSDSLPVTSTLTNERAGRPTAILRGCLALRVQER